ncbi:MAG: HAMP domain-containing protein [Pseudobacteriovorax sp.]|nr:HAMP domain-containing protein [Pseudobacteriovorax sp.]
MIALGVRGKILFLLLVSVLLSSTFIAMGVFYRFDGFFSDIMDIRDQSFRKNEESLKQISQKNRDKIAQIYEEQTYQKALSLARRDKLVLADQFVENSVFTIINYVNNAFRMDESIIRASFFSRTDGTLSLWVLLSDYEDIPKLEFAVYNEVSQSWSLKTEDRTYTHLDSSIAKSQSVQGIDIAKGERTITREGVEKLIDVLEVTVPVHDPDIESVTGAIEEGEPVGYLTYLISLEAITKTIAQEKKVEKQSLASLSQQAIEDKQRTAQIITDSENELLKVSAGIFFASILITAFFGTIIAARLVKPIRQLTKAATEMEQGNYDGTFSVDSRDEIGRLAYAFKSMRSQIKSYTSDLENMVQERTEKLNLALADLTAKSANIRAILENISLGIFMISKDGTVGSETSHYLGEILDRDTASLDEFFWNRLQLTDYNLSLAKTSLHACLGGDDIGFEINRHLLPEEVFTKDERILEVNWSSIVLDNKVENILVCLRDVTELRQLKSQLETQQTDMQYIMELLNAETDRTNSFFQSAFGLIEKSHLTLSSDKSNVTKLDEMFRNIHTIKGNASLIGFTHIGEKAHQMEDYIDTIRKEGVEEISSINLNPLINMLRKYQSLRDEKIPGNRKIHDSIHLIKSDIFSVVEKMDPEAVRGELIEDIFSRQTVTVESIVYEAEIESIQTAISIGVLPPKFVYRGDCLLISDSIYQLLKNCMNHLIRNSLAHGIESEAERRRHHKQIHGTIRVMGRRISDEVYVLEYDDDGQGIDLEAIRDKIVAMGNTDQIDLTDPYALAKHIFVPSFSTKTEVTNIAGRGIGMDAIRSFLESVEGSIDIRLESTRELSRVPFTLVMTLKDPLSTKQNEAI